MNIDSFLAHYGLRENPFGAEEARHDPVFERLAEAAAKHPDFPKLMGSLERPTASVAFGEKGSGKTAMRLQLGREFLAHNQNNPDERVFLVPYDDFNPLLDDLMKRTGQDANSVLDRIRLEEHQDWILSEAVTRLCGTMLGEPPSTGEPVLLPDSVKKKISAMPRQSRVDLAILAALYDQPREGTLLKRWRKVRSTLQVGPRATLGVVRYLALILTVVAVALGGAAWQNGWEPTWLAAAAGGSALAAVLGLGWWFTRSFKLRRLAKKITQEMPGVRRSPRDLREMLKSFNAKDLAHQPFPMQGGGKDSRYQLTRRFLNGVGHLGYRGMVVLLDRVDEPSHIRGDSEKAQKLVWPILDNTFLQQEGVGIKMLMPMELRHAIHRESPAFFQRARLDKQHMIDRLTWSGTTLYDLCTQRLQACRPTESEPLSLTDLFASDVTRAEVIEALDHMQQPRDVFKFLYSVIQEHCRLVPEPEPTDGHEETEASFRIAKLTLENVRRAQSQRVQELSRGLAPA